MLNFTSKIDTNQYKFLRLKNLMKVLLISNEHYQKSSCCLSVRAGSYDEPDDFPGLAHFLEHMLFTGNEKYPNRNEYNEYLAAHGGYSHAYTENELTVYYLEVDSNYLEGAADRFSQHFISSLFSSDSVKQELQELNSEYLNSLNNPDWKHYGVSRLLMKKEHHASRFAFGNLQTLDKGNILEAVKYFKNEFYSSDIMTLVICGNKNLDELERIAEMFSTIPNKSRKEFIERRYIHRIYSSLETYEIYDKNYLGKIIQYESLDEEKNISVIITLPPLREKFLVNPLEYINFMLTSREPGRLLDRYKTEKLALAISFDYDHYQEYSIATIYIQLTDLGSQNHQKVLKMLELYISEMIVDEKEYLRVKKIKSPEFEFGIQGSAVDFAVSICPDLHFYPNENILNFRYCFEDFDKELISKVIKRIANKDNWIILLDNKEGVSDCEDNVYKVKYRVLSDYSNSRTFETTVENYKTINDNFKYFGINGNTNQNSNINYESSNINMSTDNRILKSNPKLSLKEDFFLEDIKLIIQKPERIYLFKKDKNLEVHHVFDCKFKVPRNILKIDFKGKDMIKNILAAQILFRLGKDLFFEQYARQMENFHIEISIKHIAEGISIQLEGISTKILEMTENFFKVLKNLSLDRFEMAKKALNEYYSNILTQSPYKRLLEVFASKFFSKKSSEELYDQLKFIEKSEIKLPESLEISVLSVGNLEFSDLINFIESLEITKDVASKEYSTLENENNDNGEGNDNPQDNHKEMEVNNEENMKMNVGFDSLSFLSSDKNNNAIAFFFNINSLTKIPAPTINYETDLKECLKFTEGRSYRYNSCVGRLINQIAHEKFCIAQKTFKEPNNIACCFVRKFSSAEYLIFTIQSNKSVEDLERRINDFIEYLKQYIKNMTDDEFALFKDILACFLKNPPLSLDDLRITCQNQLAVGSLDLNLGPKLAELVMTLTKEDLINSPILEKYSKVFSFSKD